MSKIYWKLDDFFKKLCNNFKKSYKYLCKTATQTNITFLVQISFYYFLTKIKIVYIKKYYTIIQDSLLYNVIN